MVQAGQAPVLASAPTACQVQCAGCRRILNVPSGIVNFQCPKCKLPQVLPLQLRTQGLARGIDSTKIQLPCANCRAVLNVPPGLTRFVCPQCRVELAVDPAKLAAYMSSLLHLNNVGNEQGSSGVSTTGYSGSIADGMEDSVWSKQLGASGYPMEEVSEVGLGNWIPLLRDKVLLSLNYTALCRRTWPGEKFVSFGRFVTVFLLRRGCSSALFQTACRSYHPKPNCGILS